MIASTANRLVLNEFFYMCHRFEMAYKSYPEIRGYEYPIKLINKLVLEFFET